MRCSDISEMKEPDSINEIGISVITPSYRGEKYISKLLESMKNQSLSYHLFEHIIVINGEVDNTPQIIEFFKKQNPQINVRVIYLNKPNVSDARNIGIDEANKKYSTFIDDDDYISPNFLEELYKNAKENRIVITRLKNVDENGKLCYTNINDEIKDKKGVIHDSYSKITRIFTFNACKLIPTVNLKKMRFNKELSSGEDVVFFSELIITNDFELFVLEEETNATYYRVLRPNSISRKKLSYEFNFKERLAVITELNRIISMTDDNDKINSFKIKIKAQVTFINEFLVNYPNYYPELISTIKKLNLIYFPYSELNKNLAKKLFISFNYLPYSGTSFTTLTKRVNEHNEPVDIIQNYSCDIQNENNDFNFIIEHLTEKQIIIDSNRVVGCWNNISNICKNGMEKLNQMVRLKGEYREIYSISMFPTAHYLAFEYKFQYPNVKWTAEFSDRLIYNTNENLWDSKINDQKYIDKINTLLSLFGFPIYDFPNIFNLCQYLTYVFADKLIFTSINQKRYVINKFIKNKELTAMIEHKSTIKPTPTLGKEFYKMIESDYHLENNHINLAYFGYIHNSTDLEDLFYAFYSLDDKYKKKCKIHLFTDVEGFKKSIQCNPILGNLIINPYKSYLEFLNLTKKFDCLIVYDRHYNIEINPHLPSKLSDYQGSGTDIWAICEEDSAMSKYEFKYKSTQNDIKSIRATLKRII